MRSDATPSEAIKLEFTKHAARVMVERAVSVEWVERVVSKPKLREPDPNDPEVERFFCPIPERNDRVLRVAVNTRVSPWRVVSVFFDRNMKGEL